MIFCVHCHDISKSIYYHEGLFEAPEGKELMELQNDTKAADII